MTSKEWRCNLVHCFHVKLTRKKGKEERKDSVSGFCEHGNEPFGPVKGSEFLDQLSGFYPAPQIIRPVRATWGLAFLLIALVRTSPCHGVPCDSQHLQKWATYQLIKHLDLRMCFLVHLKRESETETAFESLSAPEKYLSLARTTQCRPRAIIWARTVYFSGMLCI